ncbi:MAG: S46 family peptidase [Ignavibacteria bacterium]|nr:S46 family peptidase [Ignavibacteria bacterium]
MKKSLFVLVFLFLFTFSVRAQEGMWLLNQIQNLNLEQKGLEISPDKIYSSDKDALYKAIIQLGGGTASFISSEGLIITNHHVAYAGLQRASTKENDYLMNGFVAFNRSDEIPAQGYFARLLLEMKDVTNEIIDATKGLTDPMEINKKTNEKITEITTEITKGTEDIIANVAEMYNGKQYILFKYKLFQDIRIVFAPPSSIGNYGDDIDNWMWPRHTGDFTFMRVYVSPDGKGKEYSKDNVPYKPEVWLKVAEKGLEDNDFTFILGYPGQTTRYRSSTSVEWNMTKNYPFSIKNFKEIEALIEEITKNDREGRIKISNLFEGIANVRKNFEGKLEGMQKTNFLQKKIHFEQEFMNWVNDSPDRKTKYGDVLKKEKEQYDNLLEKTKDKDNILGMFQGLSGTPLSAALRLLNLKSENEKPEGDRDPALTSEIYERQLNNIKNQYYNSYEPVDKALLVRTLKMADNLDSKQRIKGTEYILKDKSRSIEEFVNNAFSKSKFVTQEGFETVLNKSVKELKELKDPIMDVAVNLYPELEEFQNTNRIFGANVAYYRKLYLDALYEWKGSDMYPDANGTMRFTYGNIKGYKPRDAVWYYPFTSLKGVIEKNTGEIPFDAPEKLVDLYESRNFGNWADKNLNDIPVAFTHLGDITGGNSGSPIMNSKGEIIGVAFDGNYEGMISDWQFDYDLQRVISVDIRHVLFITEKFANADFILREIGLK